MLLDTRHEYWVYRDGRYLGNMPNIKSPFEYDQDLNTAGTQIQIEIATSIDTAFKDVEPLQTELGDTITTENEQVLTTESATPIIGGKDSGLILANGNDIFVYEFSDYHPNGVLVFSGYQSKMRTIINEEDSVLVTAISYGKDLNDYIYGNGVYSLQQSLTSFNDNAGMHRVDQPSSQIPFYALLLDSYNFTLSKLSLEVALGSYLNESGTPSIANVTVNVYSGTPTASGALVATATSVISSSSFSFVEFVLSQSVVLTTSTPYWVSIQADDYVLLRGRFDGSGALTTYSSIDLVTWFVNANSNISTKLYSGGSNTDAIFTAYDPSQMIRDTITGYNSQGGDVVYTGSSVDSTGYSLDYTFITATPLEIIKKARELAPADWYWYVDIASQVVTFKATLTTATHKFVIGKHIERFEMEATIEYIRNVVYFTGGPTAGVNLLKKYTDVASLAINRLAMERLTDNRIVAANEASAFSIADSYMDENNDEVFTAEPIFINEETFDVTLIKVGATASVVGMGNFVDALIFQITSVSRVRGGMRLTFGKLPLRSSAYVDEIKRKLDDQQTLDNPSAPS